ncbi:MAG: class I SAM-dependent methyltransferase [Solirubrobacterales bacterium]
MNTSRTLTRRVYDASWGRLFAAGYERALADTENAGLRDRRRALLAEAEGRTLELGSGTGLNLPHYPAAVGELILAEPFEPMAGRLRERVAAAERPAQVIVAPAERLPIESGSVDTVVVTLVLCTVDDVGAALGEIARVLRPGGQLLFIEHVRSRNADLARWQDRLERPWRFVGHGCHCNRDTLAAIEASPLAVAQVERGRMPKAPAIARPLIQGSARRSS